MNELSMHILDLVQNSFIVESTLVEIIVHEDLKNNLLTIEISDDGYGMDEDTVLKVVDPFFTTRTTRKVGLGLSLFKMSCEMCNGSFNVVSKKGLGTKVVAKYQYDHIDRAPLGDMVETIYLIIINHYNVEIIYKHQKNEQEFILDSKVIKEILDGVPLTNYEVMCWLKEYIREGISFTKKED